MFICKKISIYTGKVLAKEVFNTSTEAIAFCNSNVSASGAFRWVLFTNRFIK